MNDAGACVCVCTVQGCMCVLYAQCMEVCVCIVQGCVCKCLCTVWGVCVCTVQVSVCTVQGCVHTVQGCVCAQYRCVCVYVSVLVHACGEHRSTLVSSFPVLSLPFWDSASLNLELTSLSKWAGQSVPRALLSLHDQHWNHSSTTLHPDFMWVLRIQTQTRSLCSKHFSN